MSGFHHGFVILAISESILCCFSSLWRWLILFTRQMSPRHLLISKTHSCFLIVADEAGRFSSETRRNAYTLHGNNGNFILESYIKKGEQRSFLQRFLLFLGLSQPLPPVLWSISDKSRNHDAESSLSEASTPGVKPLQFSVRALADLADILIFQIESQPRGSQSWRLPGTSGED